MSINSFVKLENYNLYKVTMNNYANQKLILSDNTMNFLDAVVNPFGVQRAAYVPDSLLDHTICLRDNATFKPVNDSLDPAYYFGLWFTYGLNDVRTSYSNKPGQMYELMYAYFDANGTVIGGPAYSHAYSLYDEIFGSSNNYDYTDSLVTALRIYSVGIRVTSDIELITDSTTSAIRRFHGCQVDSEDIRAVIQGVNPIVQVVLNAPDYHSFANEDGITVRFNPFQDDDQLDMISCAAFTTVRNQTAAYRLPFVLLQFNNPVEVNDQPPVLIESCLQMECLVRSPNPFFLSPSYCDVDFDHIRKLAANSKVYPFTVSSHTFKSFTSKLSQFLAEASVFLGRSSRIVGNAPRIKKKARKAVKQWSKKGGAKIKKKIKKKLNKILK